MRFDQVPRQSTFSVFHGDRQFPLPPCRTPRPKYFLHDSPSRAGAQDSVCLFCQGRWRPARDRPRCTSGLSMLTLIRAHLRKSMAGFQSTFLAVLQCQKVLSGKHSSIPYPLPIHPSPSQFGVGFIPSRSPDAIPDIRQHSHCSFLLFDKQLS